LIETNERGKKKGTFSFTIKSDGSEESLESGPQGRVMSKEPQVENIRLGEDNINFRTAEKTQAMA
jgi:hypothetical protein